MANDSRRWSAWLYHWCSILHRSIITSGFNGFGLTKGALLATEAAASFGIYVTKSLTFGALGVLHKNILIAGVAVGFL